MEYPRHWLSLKYTSGDVFQRNQRTASSEGARGGVNVASEVCGGTERWRRGRRGGRSPAPGRSFPPRGLRGPSRSALCHPRGQAPRTRGGPQPSGRAASAPKLSGDSHTCTVRGGPTRKAEATPGIKNKGNKQTDFTGERPIGACDATEGLG